MFKHYLKIAYRNLLKNKMLSLVNLFGLTLGLASIMTLVFVVHVYYNADGFIEEEENVYYLKTFTTSGHDYNQTTYPLLEKIKNSCPDVVAGTHFFDWDLPLLSYQDIELQERRTSYVDADFFEVFTLPLKYGDDLTALKNKYDVVLTDKVSKKFFGEINPVGKKLVLNDTLSVKVAGVLEPISSYASLRLGVLLSTQLVEDYQNFKEHTGWSNSFTYNMIRLNANADVQKFENQVLDLVRQNYAEPSHIKAIKVVPYTEVRVDNIPIAGIIIKGAIATIIFVLLIVLVNLINLNTSVMYGRTRQLAVKKILGDHKKSIVFQFCLENGLLVLISLVVASFLFAWVLLPEINEIFGGNFGEIAIEIPNDYPVILYFLGLGIFITLIVGTLPTLRFISLPIAIALKGKINGVRKNLFFRNVFIVVQFSLAILFICTAIILNYQISFMKNAPLGYEQENISIARIDLEYTDKESAESKFSEILDKLKSNPFVQDFSTTQIVPSAYYRNYTNFMDPETGKEVRVRHGRTDANYFKTLDIPLLSGRHFKENQSDIDIGTIIINAKAMKALGWTDLENKRLVNKGEASDGFKVVGVTKDFHYQGMQNDIEPLAHFYKGKQQLKNNNYLMLKIVKGKEQQVLKQLENDFAQIPSKRTFEYEMLSHKTNAQYDLLRGILKTVNFVAFFTILISCLGMFGLISLIAKKRVKEIGVRKVLGASITRILLLLSKEFIALVIIAGCIAIPVAWWLMNNWLQTFAYRIDIRWWMMVLGGLLALLIVGITVGIQSFKSAMVNPIKSLRVE
ncbi:ABC transporter permease [Aquimarina sp. 2201CG1-2-11]|uniref:ABC transporter permease n=1 Tax=Aquimarina discodermiae TaxID=3231043 RepID=UPI0034631C9A